MRLLSVIFLLGFNSILLSASTDELETDQDFETCPSGISAEIPKLGDYRTPEGQDAIVSNVLNMLQSWETVPPSIKKLIQDQAVHFAWERNIEGSDSLAIYDVGEKKIGLYADYVDGLAWEIEGRVAREEIAFYLALYLLPVFSHELQHAVNDFYGFDFDVRENEFSAYSTELVVTAESMARYPEIYDFYKSDSFSDDYLPLEFLGEFLAQGPDAIWTRIDDLYEDLPYLEEELEANLILQVFRRHAINPDADPKYKKALASIEQEDEAIYNYYDNEINWTQNAWTELSRLRDQCGESLIAPPSNIADQILPK